MGQDAPHVLVDTDVFSHVFVRRASPERDRWKGELVGRRVLIAFQTQAELLQGAFMNGWGQARMGALFATIDSAPVIPVDDGVIAAYARLGADCAATGHPLHQKIHTADRWVAACAIRHGLPLLSADAVFKNTPGLTVL